MHIDCSIKYSGQKTHKNMAFGRKTKIAGKQTKEKTTSTKEEFKVLTNWLFYMFKVRLFLWHPWSIQPLRVVVAHF